MAADTLARTVTVPGAELAYYVTGDLSRPGRHRPLLMVGSPMDSTGFGTLAGHFTDRAVVRLDPRNVGASRRDEATAPVTAQQHAADLHAVIEDMDAGPVDAFASSGGAMNALALVAAYPDDLATLVAHEPPAAGLLPDRTQVVAVFEDLVSAYDRSGIGPALARFMGVVMHRGPFTSAYLDHPAPDPAAFGLPTADDGSRDDPLIANLRGGGIDFAPDAEAIRRAQTTVVVAAGEESGGPQDGELAARSAYAVAAALGQTVVIFPGGHQGFLGGEFGQTGRPAEFASRLREVLG